MKFSSYVADGKASYGLVTGSGIVDLGRRIGAEYPSLKALIAGDALARAGAFANEAADYPADGVDYLPVIPDPLHLWCLALNYVEHHAEVEAAGRVQELPKKPALFARVADSVTGHEQPLHAPSVSEQFDYEGELMVIIGKGGRNIAEADAMAHVAGYAVCNEGSIRDWQFHTKQITPGKNFWHSGAVGPCMVTADEIADPHALSIRTWLNDQLVQDGTTADMLYKIPAFIAYVSTIAPLVPGDMLSTGTPSGVGFSRKPPLWMKAGDRCTIEIEGVGRLSNPVVADA
jgi:2-keto-4-pentenoate hydratase/2-oxohepta-3-ene-1,7-dioic acid hydratase in catechol pathway